MPYVTRQGWTTQPVTTQDVYCDFCGANIPVGAIFWFNQLTHETLHTDHLECFLKAKWQQTQTPGNVYIMDSDPARQTGITEGGVWNNVAHARAYHSEYRQSTVNGDYQEFTFYGVGVLVYVFRDNAAGTLNVQIDNDVARAFVTANNLSTAEGVFEYMFVLGGLTNGVHTCRCTAAVTPVKIDHYLIIEDERALHTLANIENRLNVSAEIVRAFGNTTYMPCSEQYPFAMIYQAAPTNLVDGDVTVALADQQRRPIVRLDYVGTTAQTARNWSPDFQTLTDSFLTDAYRQNLKYVNSTAQTAADWTLERRMLSPDTYYTSIGQGYSVRVTTAALATGTAQAWCLTNPAGSGKTIQMVKMIIGSGPSVPVAIEIGSATEAEPAAPDITTYPRYIGGGASVTRLRIKVAAGDPAGWVSMQAVSCPTANFWVPADIVYTIPAGEEIWWHHYHGTGANAYITSIWQWIEF